MPSPVNKDVARYLQAMLPVWFSIDPDVERGKRPREGMVSLRTAAEQLGVSYPSLRAVIRTATGAGIEFEQAIAKIRFRGDVGLLRRSAQEWATGGADLSAVEGSIADDVAQREELSDFDAALEDFDWPPGVAPSEAAEVVRLARQSFFKTDEPVGVAYWRRHLTDMLSEVRGRSKVIVHVQQAEPDATEADISPERRAYLAAKSERIAERQADADPSRSEPSPPKVRKRPGARR